eukprot:gnl/Trimastix_PCT/2046.p1 GENE.gnl/Trimastix_PCT/2046~~gnl/Trimastix_PCT/2046.p1  ORF type:complete len:262 (-),score=73.39 gnl/Trimastix_PCT/2046:200-985(-)
MKNRKASPKPPSPRKESDDKKQQKPKKKCSTCCYLCLFLVLVVLALASVPIFGIVWHYTYSAPSLALAPEDQNGIFMVYGSPCGSTREMAEVIAKELQAICPAHPVRAVHADVARKMPIGAIKAAPALIIGFPFYATGATPDMMRFLRYVNASLTPAQPLYAFVAGMAFAEPGNPDAGAGVRCVNKMNLPVVSDLIGEFPGKYNSKCAAHTILSRRAMHQIMLDHHEDPDFCDKRDFALVREWARKVGAHLQGQITCLTQA